MRYVYVSIPLEHTSSAGGSNEQSLQVIDYRQHDPLHEYLAKEHGETRFDAIVDTVGIQELYTNSPGYLREGGQFVNIGAMQAQSANGSLLAFAWTMVLNLALPTWLGGTPRRYQMVMGTPGADVLARVKKLAEDGVLVPIIDSTWEMEDALKVCPTFLSHGFDDTYQWVFSRHMKNFIPSEQEERLLSRSRNRLILGFTMRAHVS